MALVLALIQATIMVIIMGDYKQFADTVTSVTMDYSAVNACENVYLDYLGCMDGMTSSELAVLSVSTEVKLNDMIVVDSSDSSSNYCEDGCYTDYALGLVCFVSLAVGYCISWMISIFDEG